MEQVWVYLGFIALVVVIIALDLGVMNRGAHVVSTRRAVRFTIFTIVMALLFSGAVYAIYDAHWLGFGLAVPQHDGQTLDVDGRQAAVHFLTGYLVEYSLSMDNIFVIAMVFAHFRIPARYQHRVLFWGILGALLMRGAMIATGSLLLAMLHWVIYVFGAFLLWTGFKMLTAGHDDAPDFERLWVVRMARRLYPVSPTYDGSRFMTTLDGRRALTPLALALIVVELTDVVFAVDSIPAIFAITLDPFLVFSSNVFAILGLRSLYFALAALLDKFRYLKVSLSVILMFIGVKMLAARWVHLDELVSLGVIVGLLGAGVAASLLIRPRPALSPGAPGHQAPPGTPEHQAPPGA